MIQNPSVVQLAPPQNMQNFSSNKKEYKRDASPGKMSVNNGSEDEAPKSGRAKRQVVNRKTRNTSVNKTEDQRP